MVFTNEVDNWFIKLRHSMCKSGHFRYRRGKPIETWSRKKVVPNWWVVTPQGVVWQVAIFLGCFYFIFFWRIDLGGNQWGSLSSRLGSRPRTLWETSSCCVFFLHSSFCRCRRRGVFLLNQSRAQAKTKDGRSLGGPFADDCFSLIWLGFTDLHWLLIGLIGFNWILPAITGFYGVLLSFTGFSWILPSFTEFYWVLIGFIGLNWVLLGFTGYYWVLLDITWFYWVLLSFIGFYWLLLGFIGFYWVLLGFTGFYKVLLGITGFYWVLLGFYWALLSFYWDLLGFTGIYWDLLGFFF